MTDDLSDREGDATDPNGSMAADLLDAWRHGDDVFLPTLSRCLAEFDVAEVITVLTSMNLALIEAKLPTSHLDLDEHLAVLREEYGNLTYPNKETSTP